jgi:hypothetical protein
MNRELRLSEQNIRMIGGAGTKVMCIWIEELIRKIEDNFL